MTDIEALTLALMREGWGDGQAAELAAALIEELRGMNWRLVAKVAP